MDEEGVVDLALGDMDSKLSGYSPFGDKRRLMQDSKEFFYFL